MISHGNLTGATARVQEYLRHTADDRILTLMPLNAPWGLLQWLLAREANASVVLPPPIAMGAEVAKVVRAAAVTGLAALPPTWIQLVDCLLARGETLPELRYVTTSGGIVPARILEAFPRVFPNAQIWMTYGLTEAFRTTVVPAGEYARCKGSLGWPCPGVGIEILDANGSRVADGEIGELVHAGPCVTLGYWRRPEETLRSYGVRTGHEAVLGTGRVHYSGDLVRRDADGCLWFEGRDDHLIKTGGYRVSADEIEGCLLAVSGVSHAVVVGVPDEALGQRVVAAVESVGAPDEVLDRARALLRQTLGSHLQPQTLHAWPGLMPLTPNGKLDRVAVQGWLREQAC
jgi:acyl-CoA synthetase (AMP-forming)/AMP-acid ligase II